MSCTQFTSPLAESFTRFVELKQASGISYRAATEHLYRFDSFLAEHLRPGARLEPEFVQRFIASKAHLVPRGLGNIVTIVWQALEYARRHGADIAALPDRPQLPSRNTRKPFIYSQDEMNRILLAALQFGPANSLRPHTFATLFALLYVTGLRLGEARRLKLSDTQLDNALLKVRETKFRKSRIVPCSKTTVQSLERYLQRRKLAKVRCDSEAPLFVSLRHMPLSGQTIRYAFHQTLKVAGLLPERGPKPRLHDLRHTFALNRVIAWYRAGVDVNSKLPALSTYLGHCSVSSTQVYLQPTEALLREAAQRFEDCCGAARVTDGEVDDE